MLSKVNKRKKAGQRRLKTRRMKRIRKEKLK
jgi:hypothetical protein